MSYGYIRPPKHERPVYSGKFKHTGRPKYTYKPKVDHFGYAHNTDPHHSLFDVPIGHKAHGQPFPQSSVTVKKSWPKPRYVKRSSLIPQPESSSSPHPVTLEEGSCLPGATSV